MNKTAMEKQSVEKVTDPVEPPPSSPTKEDEKIHGSLEGRRPDSSPNHSGAVSRQDSEDALATEHIPVLSNDSSHCRAELVVQRSGTYTCILVSLSTPMPGKQRNMAAVSNTMKRKITDVLSSLSAAAREDEPHNESTSQQEKSQDEKGNENRSDGSGGSAHPEETAICLKKRHVETETTIVPPSVFPLGIKYLMLQELLLACDAARDNTYDLPPLEESYKNFTRSDYRNIIHHRLVQTVNMHRPLGTFMLLSKDDHMAMVRGRIIEIALIHCSIKHNMETGMTYVGYPGTPYVCFEMTKCVKGNYYEDTLKLKKTFPEKYRTNESIYAILCVIALFNPDCPNVSNKAAITNEQLAYRRLLKEYLESTYGEEEGRLAFKHLTCWTNYLCLWSEKHHPRPKFDIDPYTFRVSNVCVDSGFD